MKPAAFDYAAPDSLDEALSLKAQHGDDAKFLAGGQSLVPAMNFRLVQAELLIDVNKLSQLQFIREEAGELRIGAMTRQRQLERSAQVKASAPLMYDALPFVAHPQIRNRGTIGGSLAHADPAAELPVIAVALDARFRLQSTRSDRWVDAVEFFKGLFMTELNAEEMLTEVAVPVTQERRGTAFVEFSRRRGDYAVMGVAAKVTLDTGGVCQMARLVYLNAGDGPVDAVLAARTLTGHRPSPTLLREAAETAAETELSPMGNVHASAAYQKHLAKVLTIRALQTAFERGQSA